MDKITVKFVDIGDIKWKDLRKLPFITREDYVKADGYKTEDDKIARLISAYLKRKYVGIWQVGVNGKPVAAGKFFNVSHTKGAVVFVASDGDVGVDIEKTRPVSGKLKRYVATDEEYAYIKDDMTFFEIWTAKESLAKAAGFGVVSRAETIPALPLDGKKRFNGAEFFSRCVKTEDYVISVARKGSPFDVVIENETLPL
ncbi:MAG: 4'-phosphopantetheinyl transferase superfamily protein [Clostridia bacterium]|nr:4'-phosphopantetheinyl transferase superfamily protein [Clostridia bacterium]